jgi:hypothetical protein
MKLLLQVIGDLITLRSPVIGDLITLRSPLKIRDPHDLALSLAQWVFLLILSLTITATLIAAVGQ